MSTSCKEQRLAVLECLADSECIKAGKSIKECMTEDAACKELNYSLFLCKRGQVRRRSPHSASLCRWPRPVGRPPLQLDMRKRIKGNMPDDNPKDE